MRPWLPTAALALLALLPARSAHAWKLEGAHCPSPFEMPARVVIDQQSILDAELPQDAIERAIRDVNAEVMAVEGTDIVLTTVVLEDSPETRRGDIVVRFESPPSDHPAWADSRPRRADLSFDPDILWFFGAPPTWYDSTAIESTGRSFRQVYLHELLHALRLDHTGGELAGLCEGWGVDRLPEGMEPRCACSGGDHYAFMAYGDYPWATGPLATQVRPLPDDREGLRQLYPGPGTATDLAVYNTWLNGTRDLENDVAEIAILCRPSTGDRFWTQADGFSLDSLADPREDDTDGPLCGLNGSTRVCPGDSIYTRYVVSNMGLTEQAASHDLWLSLDETWSPGIDLRAPGARGGRHHAAESHLMEEVWQVPHSVEYGETYHPIVRVWDEGVPETYDHNNWIPLRGRLRIKSEEACNPDGGQQSDDTATSTDGGQP